MTAQYSYENSRLTGIVLVLASAAVFGLAGTLTKAIEADAWTIASWRGLLGALMIGGYIWLRRGDRPAPQLFAVNWKILLIACVGAAASIAFIGAFKLTYVANVTIIYATVPFVAALLERLIIGTRASTATITAATISFAGVMIMVGGGLGQGVLAGDALAVVMMVGNALYIVLIRAFRESGVLWAGALSGVLLFLVSWFVTDPLAMSGRDAVLILAFGVAFAVAVILWTEGTIRISAAESAFFGTSELVFAIAFAWLFLAEIPPLASFAGGAFVIAAILWQIGRERTQKDG